MALSTTIARPYSKAIFDIAKNKNKFDEWDNALSHLSILFENKNLIDFIKNKTISNEKKFGILQKLIETIDKEIVLMCENLIKTLCYHNRLLYIKEIKTLYNKLVNEEKNIIKMTIEIAYHIDNVKKNELINLLSIKFNKKIAAFFIINEKLLGGFLIKIEDFVIDASINGNIKFLKNKVFI